MLWSWLLEQGINVGKSHGKVLGHCWSRILGRQPFAGDGGHAEMGVQCTFFRENVQQKYRPSQALFDLILGFLSIFFVTWIYLVLFFWVIHCIDMEVRPWRFNDSSILHVCEFDTMVM